MLGFSPQPGLASGRGRGGSRLGTLRYACPVETFDLGQPEGAGLYQIAARAGRLPPLLVPRPGKRHQQGCGSIIRSAGAGQGVAGGGAGNLAVAVLVVVLRRPAFVLDLPAALCLNVEPCLRHLPSLGDPAQSAVELLCDILQLGSERVPLRRRLLKLRDPGQGVGESQLQTVADERSAVQGFAQLRVLRPQRSNVAVVLGERDQADGVAGQH